MRAAYVCADTGVRVFGHKGGSIHVQEVIRCLRRDGITVELFAARTGGEAPPDLADVPVHTLPRGRKGDARVKEREALARNSALSAALSSAGSFDFVYERHALWSYAGMEYARDRGVPGLLEVNAPLIEEQRRYRELVLEDEAARAVERAFGAASSLLAVSRGVAAYLERSPGARGRIHVVPNGVDPDRFSPGPPPVRAAASGGLTIGFVGTLKPWHGVGMLVNAFARLHEESPDVRLLVVGDGPERAGLEADLEARGVRHAAEFVGAVPPGEIPALLARMDIAVAPYPPLEDFYFSPLKLFEYMAAGRAIVAAAIGQITEVIEPDVTGLLYAPGDVDGLVTALRRLRDDDALRLRCGRAARATVIRDHSWSSVVRRILEIARSSSSAPASQEVT